MVSANPTKTPPNGENSIETTNVGTLRFFRAMFVVSGGVAFASMSLFLVFVLLGLFNPASYPVVVLGFAASAAAFASLTHFWAAKRNHQQIKELQHLAAVKREEATS